MPRPEAPPGRLPVVGVMGSGTAAHEARAGALGNALAGLSVHLLTGGGRGTMEAVSRAFAEVPHREGLVVGILPSTDSGMESRLGYPNPWVELVIRTHLPLTGERGSEPLSRNHINVLSADVVIALPGGPGTLSEVLLALQYGRPVVGYLLSASELPGLPDGVPVSGDLGEVLSFVTRALGGGAGGRAPSSVA